jgi:membrane-associated HD superfamily phosphohydrolase
MSSYAGHDQLIIVGHVKDGIEIAREFGLPPSFASLLKRTTAQRSWIYFYHEARKRQDERKARSQRRSFAIPAPSRKHLKRRL